jgi:8-oxo-dGTP pyrophosphatase MutT (NUDIX family)
MGYNGRQIGEKETAMITFDLPGARFFYRVAAVILHEGRVLLNCEEAGSHWFLPGGRCEAMEPSSVALRREMQEELGETVTIERMLWVVENLFTVAGRPHHELGLYYLATLPPTSPLLDGGTAFRGQEQHIPLILQWFPLEETARLPIYPVFLRTSLQNLPDRLEHIVNHDSRAPIDPAAL